MIRADNLPDDWDSYRHTCSECGSSYHDSGVDECACVECARCSEMKPPHEDGCCYECARHLDEGGCAAAGCSEQSCEHGDGQRCWAHVVEELEADLSFAQSKIKVLTDELKAAQTAVEDARGAGFDRGYEAARQAGSARIRSSSAAVSGSDRQ